MRDMMKKEFHALAKEQYFNLMKESSEIQKNQEYKLNVDELQGKSNIQKS